MAASSKICVFCQMGRSSTSSPSLYADDRIIAFSDINPSAVRHYLVIPIEHIPTVNDLHKGVEDYQLVSHMLDVGRRLVKNEAPESKLYRFGFHRPPFNSVNHLHLHCIALPFIPRWKQLKYLSLGPLGGFIEAEKLLERIRPLKHHHYTFPCAQRETWPLLCTKLFTWEASSPYSIDAETNIMKDSNIVEHRDVDESTELPLLQSEENIIDMSNQQFLQHQPLKWPMWLLGPSILLATGMLPTLWLPLSSVFIGPNTAGLLSLIGLDCIFNIGATVFLLMADACARPLKSSSLHKIQVPLPYMLWNMGASLLGFLAPLSLLFASQRGSLVPHISFISFAVLLGPYLLLLSVQIMAEMLTWHWKSPVWLVTPIVYEAYRILQLMRGLRLGDEVSAPGWAITSIRLLVSWWALILGIQLMRVAWFAGLNYGRWSTEAV